MQRRVFQILAATAGVLASSGVALAHGGGLRSAAPESLVVPAWLFIMTGGGVIGVSFLLASLLTDRDLVRSLHNPIRTRSVPTGGVRGIGAAFGVLALVFVAVTGIVSPPMPLRNPAILVVWVGWWAGFTMFVYGVGNVWPTIDPFRALASVLGRGTTKRSVDANRAAWVSAFGLVALFGIEVVSPLAENGALLAAAVVGYLAVTVLGSRLIGIDAWFEYVDPLSRAFRLYGAIAPLGRTEDGIVVRLPAAGLTDDLLDGQGGVAFVVALVWGTTFDGFIGTPLWAELAVTAVTAGVPPLALYLGTLVLGFALFLAVYRGAARAIRRTAPTYISTGTLSRRFAPSLVAIAAGYHLAHNLPYFLSLTPLLAAAVTNPLSPPFYTTALVLPGWTTYLPMVFILLGHVFAVLVAHAVTFDLVPGRLQAIRSQYPLTAVMILYTMTSLWIVSQPTVAPPYL